jgi:hypothetical protein
VLLVGVGVWAWSDLGPGAYVADGVGAPGLPDPAAVPALPLDELPEAAFPDLAIRASGEAPAGLDSAGQPVDYVAANALDGDLGTTWRVGGEGVGERLTIDLGVEVDLAQVGLVPGYAKVDEADGTDRFTQNRRVVRARLTFEDGTVLVASFSEEPVPQAVPVDVTTSRVVVEVLETTPHGGRDFTAISEVVLVPAG